MEPVCKTKPHQISFTVSSRGRFSEVYTPLKFNSFHWGKRVAVEFITAKCCVGFSGQVCRPLQCIWTQNLFMQISTETVVSLSSSNMSIKILGRRNAQNMPRYYRLLQCIQQGGNARWTNGRIKRSKLCLCFCYCFFFTVRLIKLLRQQTSSS